VEKKGENQLPGGENGGGKSPAPKMGDNIEAVLVSVSRRKKGGFGKGKELLVVRKALAGILSPPGEKAALGGGKGGEKNRFEEIRSSARAIKGPRNSTIPPKKFLSEKRKKTGRPRKK